MYRDIVVHEGVVLSYQGGSCSFQALEYTLEATPPSLPQDHPSSRRELTVLSQRMHSIPSGKPLHNVVCFEFWPSPTFSAGTPKNIYFQLSCLHYIHHFKQFFPQFERPVLLMLPCPLKSCSCLGDIQEWTFGCNSFLDFDLFQSALDRRARDIRTMVACNSAEVCLGYFLTLSIKALTSFTVDFQNQ